MAITKYKINQQHPMVGHKCCGISSHPSCLTHCGRVTHICVGKLNTIGSDNGLSPGRRQAIIWTIAGILLIGTLGTNLSEILIGNSNIFIPENAFENVVCRMESICLGLNVLTHVHSSKKESTVDSRYLAPVGSQNSRARVKWFSRYQGPNSRLPGSESHTVTSAPLKPKQYVER